MISGLVEDRKEIAAVNEGKNSDYATIPFGIECLRDLHDSWLRKSESSAARAVGETSARETFAGLYRKRMTFRSLSGISSNH
jgi:hypothetical protein